MQADEWFGQPRRQRQKHAFTPGMLAAVLLSVVLPAKAETGLASYYGGRGHKGEMTCAHRTRPFGSIVTATHASHSIQCRVNDRGPFVRGRGIDVSLSAAQLRILQ
jgi:rare lipoprotein A